MAAQCFFGYLMATLGLKLRLEELQSFVRVARSDF